MSTYSVLVLEQDVLGTPHHRTLAKQKATQVNRNYGIEFRYDTASTTT